MQLFLATSWLDPIVNALASVVNTINIPVHNLGVSLIILAVLIRLAFWPLNTKQFRAMIGMQKLAPRIKALQARYKDDAKKLQEETMALYRESGVNPLAGCWPMLLQYPVLISVYWVVQNHRDLYAQTHFLWIGSALSRQLPTFFGVKLLGTSLAHSDIPLLLLYMLSMYISMRYTTMPPTDPAQAQQMKIMQILSPLMLGFFAFRAEWPSAMVLYWFAANVLMMGQQLLLLKRYHEPLAFIDSEVPITESAALPVVAAQPKGNNRSKLASSGAANGAVTKPKNKTKKGAKK
ncbi:MAG: YidC/Oxa1 family membrane protein insertase [Vulcanimicrobiaceae bacterium]